MTTHNSHLQLAFTDGTNAGRSNPPGEFDPARLTQARYISGLTKREVAPQLGLTAAAVGQYEAGAIARPSPEVLQRMAVLFDVPVGFFAPGRPYTKLDPSMAHFRKLRATRIGKQNQAVACTEQVWELAYALERRVRMPTVDIPGFAEGEPHPEQALPPDPRLAARALRQHWNLGDGPIAHLVRLLESKGIITTILPLTESDAATIDAFAVGRLQRPLIALTRERATDVYRHRFTAAHELGHLVLHGDHASGDQTREREADAFAAEFLTPYESIAPLLPTRVDFATLADLQSTWGISVMSLIYRSREVGLLSSATASRAYQRLRILQRDNTAFQHQPVTSYPGELPALLQRAFELADRNGTSVTSLARELAWYPRRITALLDIPDPRPVLSLVQ